MPSAFISCNYFNACEPYPYLCFGESFNLTPRRFNGHPPENTLVHSRIIISLVCIHLALRINQSNSFALLANVPWYSFLLISIGRMVLLSTHFFFHPKIITVSIGLKPMMTFARLFCPSAAALKPPLVSARNISRKSFCRRPVVSMFGDADHYSVCQSFYWPKNATRSCRKTLRFNRIWFFSVVNERSSIKDIFHTFAEPLSIFRRLFSHHWKQAPKPWRIFSKSLNDNFRGLPLKITTIWYFTRI